MITQEDITNGIKGLEQTTTGTCQSGDVHIKVRKQIYMPSGKTKVSNTYYLNGVKVTGFQRWSVDEWLTENMDMCEYKQIKLF